MFPLIKRLGRKCRVYNVEYMLLFVYYLYTLHNIYRRKTVETFAAFLDNRKGFQNPEKL